LSQLNIIKQAFKASHFFNFEFGASEFLFSNIFVLYISLLVSKILYKWEYIFNGIKIIHITCDLPMADSIKNYLKCNYFSFFVSTEHNKAGIQSISFFNFEFDASEFLFSNIFVSYIGLLGSKILCRQEHI
jgi:hypothetical protein